MTELLGPVATTFFQTLYGQRYDEDDAKSPAADPTGRRSVLNTCHALSQRQPGSQKSLAASLYRPGPGNERSQPAASAGRLHHLNRHPAKLAG
jgi:hypothetical protein